MHCWSRFAQSTSIPSSHKRNPRLTARSVLTVRTVRTVRALAQCVRADSGVERRPLNRVKLHIDRRTRFSCPPCRPYFKLKPLEMRQIRTLILKYNRSKINPTVRDSHNNITVRASQPMKTSSHSPCCGPRFQVTNHRRLFLYKKSIVHHKLFSTGRTLDR